MATLKEYIEKAMLKVGSRGGMTAAGRISLNIANNSTYIAPCDGYLCAAFGSLTGFEFCRITSETDYQDNFGNAGESSAEFEVDLHVPLAKGQTAKVVYDASPQFFFIPSAGGLNRLISLIFFGGRYGFA